MKYKIFTVFLLLFVCISANAQTEWLGEYSFGEDGGDTAGGTKIYIEHTLKITQDGDKLNAHLYSQGFQTSKDIYADAKSEGSKLMLYFREKDKDHFLGDYKKGELLLTLERKEIGGKEKILTYWGEFQPSIDSNQYSGEIYFKKTSETVTSKADIKSEWNQIKFGDNELTIAFPKGFLIDVEKKKKIKRQARIFCFQDGVEMEINAYEGKDFLKNLDQFMRMDDRRYETFSKDEFQGRRSSLLNSTERFSESIQLASKKTYYSIKIKGKIKQKEILLRFLHSIKINGTSIFIGNKDGENLAFKNSINAQQLETSPEIIEAYDTKQKRSNQEINYELVSNNDVVDLDSEKLSRPVIIIDKPFPKPNYISGRNRLADGFYKIALKIQFLANGQIGNITYYSAKDARYTKGILESARKIKFIPAQKEGKNVDSEKMITYNFVIFSSPVIR